MQNEDIKEYFARTGIRRIARLDEALLEAFGQEEGGRHIERLDELFGQSEARLVYGKDGTVYLHRQEELVAYLNQSLQMSLLAASFYDRVFFRRVAAYLLEQDSFWSGDIYDIGCGNGILTCFLATEHPNSFVTGLDISREAVCVARELAGKLGLHNVRFMRTDESGCQTEGIMSERSGNAGQEAIYSGSDVSVAGKEGVCACEYACPAGRPQELCDTLFSCRTVHENVAWKPMCEESKAALPVEDQEQRHRQYAKQICALIKPGGHLASVERYDDDNAYAGLVRALERQGVSQVRGTHMQFSCKNGDETAVFQAAVFQKIR